jgi:hypothetical protein
LTERHEDDLRGVLHDVSNTLTVILGWADEAADPAASRESVEYAIRVIADETRRARMLARGAIGVRSERKSERAGDVITRVLGTLRIEVANAGIELVHEGALDAQVDGDHLGQILTNLLLNAIAFAKSRVVVRAELQGKTCRITVVDDGPGVPKDHVDSVFSGHTTRPDGAGVGLRHARQLAMAMGGSLELLERGSGAHFCLVWPLSQQASFASIVPPPALSSRTVLALEGARVLLLEDDVAVTSFLRVALEARGAIVHVAHVVGEIPAGQTFDVAVVDASPVNGEPDAAHAALAGACRKMLIATGDVDSLAAPFRGYSALPKPFEVVELVKRLTELLESP